MTDQLPDPPTSAASGAPAVTGRGEGKMPADATLVEVIHRYETAGFDTQFSARDGGRIHCAHCGVDSDPHTVEIVSLRRMEGASDPADMIAVVAMRCPSCDSQGVLVLNYGPDSTLEEADALLALEDRRGTAAPDVPADAAPGEDVSDLSRRS
ncbi:MAG TPA: hypothetical protein VGQ20_14275 [Acidimicrobiales bacterium]|nr:hypothetical protein [Acidimicrobiales bacterium]